MNSSIVRLYVRGFFIQTQITTHVVQRISIPEFEAKASSPLRLSELSQAAHAAVAAGNEARLREIEAEIDEMVAKLWDLTPQELEAVRESLRELG